MRIALAVILGLWIAAGNARAEADGRFVASFNSALGRPPTDDERALWAKVAGDNALFPTDGRSAVRFAYHDILQREPTPDELTKGSARLESGKSIGRLWADLSNGAEAQFVIQFTAVARYVPSPEVRNYWVTRSEQFSAAEGYAHGNAALATFPINKDYAPFVDFAYHYLLGRAPTAAESARDAERLSQANDARAYWMELFSSRARLALTSKNHACVDLATVCVK